MKTYLKLFNFSMLMTVLALAMTTCSKDNSVDPIDKPGTTVPGDTVPTVTPPTDTVKVVVQTVALNGTVRDTNGNPLSGVRVTTGSLNTTTGGDGTFSFKQAGTVDDRVIMKYEKSGYFTLTRSCEKDSDLYVEAMLYPQGNSDISLQTTFDASAAKTLQVGGMKIDFPASSVVSADGKAYSGNVHADLLYLAPDNANLTGMMPGGDWTCQLSNNNVEALQSYGITDVTLTDGSGNLLKIKEDAGVKISFPVLSAMRTGAPASLSLWSFDQTKGVWVEDGTLTLQNNAYEGTVKHFSPEAAGKSNKKMTLKVRVLACDQPKAGVKVWIRDDMDYDEYSGFTNSTGYCSATCSMSNVVNYKVFAMYNGEVKSMDVPASDFGLQIVQFNFDCPDEKLAEKAAIKIIVSDGFREGPYYLTWDNYGKRYRTDWFPNDGCRYIEIEDNIGKRSYFYDNIYGEVQTDEWTDGGSTEDVMDTEEPNLWGNTFLPTDATMKINIGWQCYTRRPNDEMLLEKLCSVYDCGKSVLFKYKRINMMQTDNQGVVIHQVLAITEDVPESAFTSTKDVSWIH